MLITLIKELLGHSVECFNQNRASGESSAFGHTLYAMSGVFPSSYLKCLPCLMITFTSGNVIIQLTASFQKRWQQTWDCKTWVSIITAVSVGCCPSASAEGVSQVKRGEGWHGCVCSSLETLRLNVTQSRTVACTPSSLSIKLSHFKLLLSPVNTCIVCDHLSYCTVRQCESN